MSTFYQAQRDARLQNKFQIISEAFALKKELDERKRKDLGGKNQSEEKPKPSYKREEMDEKEGIEEEVEEMEAQWRRRRRRRMRNRRRNRSSPRYVIRHYSLCFFWVSSLSFSLSRLRANSQQNFDAVRVTCDAIVIMMTATRFHIVRDTRSCKRAPIFAIKAGCGSERRRATVWLRQPDERSRRYLTPARGGSSQPSNGVTPTSELPSLPHLRPYWRPLQYLGSNNPSMNQLAVTATDALLLFFDIRHKC